MLTFGSIGTYQTFNFFLENYDRDAFDIDDNHVDDFSHYDDDDVGDKDDDDLCILWWTFHYIDVMIIMIVTMWQYW